MAPRDAGDPADRTAAIRASIHSGNKIVRQAQVRVDSARQQVLRAHAALWRVHRYLDEFDERRGAVEKAAPPPGPAVLSVVPSLFRLPDDLP
jgi:hypothetical protein